MITFSVPRFLVWTFLIVFLIGFGAATYLSVREGWYESWADTLNMALVSSVLLALLTLCFAAAVVSLVGIFSTLSSTARSRKEGVSTFDRRLLFNPFSTIFLSRYLTEEGLAARKKLGEYVITFIAAVGGALLIRLITPFV